MNGKKIVYNQLDNTWIIPINLSLILRDGILNLNTETDIFCVQDVDENDYYFEIQTQSAMPNMFTNSFFSINESCIMNKSNFDVETETELDFEREFFYYCDMVGLFSVVWEHVPLIKLNSYTMYYYDKKNQTSYKKTRERCDFKRVRIYNKEAIIIPTMFYTLDELKFFIKNKFYYNVQNYNHKQYAECILNFENDEFRY